MNNLSFSREIPPELSLVDRNLQIIKIFTSLHNSNTCVGNQRKLRVR